MDRLALVPSPIGRRACAVFADLIVVGLPLLLIEYFADPSSRILAFLVFVALTAAYWLYSFLLHARGGQTIGKRLVMLRVVRVDGLPIGYAESFWRNSVDFMFLLGECFCAGWAYGKIAPQSFASGSHDDRTAMLNAHQPGIAQWIMYASIVWALFDAVMVLCNPQRRALHDIIAGTMVVDEQPTTPEQKLMDSADG